MVILLLSLQEYYEYLTWSHRGTYAKYKSVKESELFLDLRILKYIWMSVYSGIIFIIHCVDQLVGLVYTVYDETLKNASMKYPLLFCLDTTK
jgi:hypothetical protein